MARGKSQQTYLDTIVEDSYADVYGALNQAMAKYPYCIGNVTWSSPSLAKRSEKYILDSDISDDDVTNEEVIDRGEYLDADVVVAKDVISDPSATTDSIVEIFELRETYEDYDPTIIAPLQSDENTSHLDHFFKMERRLADHGFSLDDEWVAVGGIKDAGTVEQLSAAIDVRHAVGGDQHVHLFGAGMSWDWAVIINRLPWLIDSLDMSTAVQQVTNGYVYDGDLEKRKFTIPRGSNTAVLRSRLMETSMYTYCHLIGPHVRDSDRPTELRDDTQRVEEIRWMIEREETQSDFEVPHEVST